MLCCLSSLINSSIDMRELVNSFWFMIPFSINVLGRVDVMFFKLGNFINITDIIISIVAMVIIGIIANAMGIS